jgi:outer membrane protein TolC
MELLLCDFGRLDAQELEARENIIAAQRDYADIQLAVFEDVAASYFSLLRNDALLAVACTNEQQYAAHLKQAETLFDAGEVKNLDVLKARLDLSDAHLKTITASNDVVTASAEFIRALGLKADVAERLDVLPPRPDSLGKPRRELPMTWQCAADALLSARTNAPSLMVLRAKVRAASARVDYAVADLLPSLSLDAGFSYVDPVWNFSWGVNAIQSLFEGYRKTSAVDAAVVEMQRQSGPKNLLGLLPDDFTKEQYYQMRQQQELSGGGESTLRTWCSRGYLTYDNVTGCYCKTEGYKQKFSKKEKIL